MLERITLKNFKLHKSTKIEARPLTIFIGPNNSGKTSIFQALLLLRQSALSNNGVLLNPVPRQPTDQDQPFLYGASHEIDAGSFEDILHPSETEIQFEISGGLEDQDPKYGGKREALFTLAFRNNQVAYHEGTLSFDVKSEAGDRRLPWSWTRGPVSGNPQHSSVDVMGRNFIFSPFDYPQMLQSQGFTFVGGTPNDPALISELSMLQNRIAAVPNSLLKSVHPVYPLRGLEESGYPVTLGPEANLDRTMLSDRTLALLSVLAYRTDVLDQVSNWLENLIQVRVRTKLVPPRRVTIICEQIGRNGRRGGLFSNEGTGASQLPFILLPIALCPPGETMTISEPEAHLHPKAQTQLGTLFIQIAQKEKKQLIIETHSEHILHSLLHSVAKGVLNKQDLAIYYFEPKQGVASVQRLTLNDHGQVEGGLPGFFEHSLDELSEYLETLKRE